MSESISQQWLIARPNINLITAQQIAKAQFSAEGEATELGSQQDRNFRITGASRQVLLKIDNSSVTDADRDLQFSISAQLRAHGVNTPSPVSTSEGDKQAVITDLSGVKTAGRAFEFIPGVSLSETEVFPGVLAERLGELAGLVVSALKNLGHEGAEREIQWEMRQADKVVEQLIHHLPHDRQNTCRQATAQALKQVARVVDSLPVQIIHADITADNVLKDEHDQLWLVDLGDAGNSWRIAELAVTAADVLGRTGSLAMVGRVVRGFARYIDLTEAELTALWPLIVLRGSVLAVSGWSQLGVDPENDYARERLEHEWQVFVNALSIDATTAEAQLRLAIGREHRAGKSYVQMFETSRGIKEIDLSITSRALDRGVWTEAGAETTIANEWVAQGNIVIARFGEARLTRVSQDVLNPTPARSSGIEVWASIGTKVYAPFSGCLVLNEGRAKLEDSGVSLSFEGLNLIAKTGKITAGEIIGEFGKDDRNEGDNQPRSVWVSRQILGAPPEPRFVMYNGEYETDGAVDPSPILGSHPAEDPSMRLVRERSRRDRSMGGASERYYDEPPQIERGWKSLLIETRGRAYLDMVNNVTAIGHSHPHMTDVLCRQFDLLNTNSRFLYESYADFTEKLLEHSPDPTLDTVIPVNSGSEALDLAIKLAQVATGRSDVLVAREGYHGWTMAADAVTTSAFDNPQALGSRPDWVHITDAPNAYRGRYRGEDAGERYLDDAARIMNEMADNGRPPAAFLSEPVLGNAGGVIPPRGYLEGVYKAVRAQGGLAIADEVQVGYGRLGHSFWASEMLGVVPDIIATAKAAGNAYPIGAVITRREIVDALRNEGMFFSSAGGAPASAVAGAAVLDVIREEGLQENALRVGEYLRQRLLALAKQHDIIGAVHGSGLYLGVELVRDHESKEPAPSETAWVCSRLLDLGVIMQATSERQNVLKVKPPLVVTASEVDAFLFSLDQALNELKESTLQ